MDVDKNSDPPSYTRTLNDYEQTVSIPIQEIPGAFCEILPYLPSNNYGDDYRAILEAATYQQAMLAATNYGSFRAYATGMTPPILEPVQIHLKKDIFAELIDPALKGTLNALNSCAKVPSIKWVVLTSSIAAVSFLIQTFTLAEDAACKFAKEKGIDLVAINPAMVIGPLLQPTLNTSAASILEAANYHQAMLAAANYGSHRTYATGMTPPIVEPVQIYLTEDVFVSKYLNENSCDFKPSQDD
ncbi:hypothetical protein GH714_039804 [Hevea brasiliensis]|uniref:NAD-dependent epimerase/dehydratase domain-containing protein n=1 Tax=Hevea brasiliensis TaxID=3981 RepID=A0A6A6KEM3_HEVBR|nr:hypothetical protein GH714_039804 [Hevea brasiliensis]